MGPKFDLLQVALQWLIELLGLPAGELEARLKGWKPKKPKKRKAPIRSKLRF